MHKEIKIQEDVTKKLSSTTIGKKKLSGTTTNSSPRLMATMPLKANYLDPCRFASQAHLATAVEQLPDYRCPLAIVFHSHSPI